MLRLLQTRVQLVQIVVELEVLRRQRLNNSFFFGFFLYDRVHFTLQKLDVVLLFDDGRVLFVLLCLLGLDEGYELLLF